MPYKDPEKRRQCCNAAYARNRDRYVESKAIRRDRIRRELREMVAAIKEASECADCGGHFPAVCMDFDHVGGDKEANVADMIGTCRPQTAILAEIAKCEVVCANCHRLRTAARLH